MDFEWVGFTFEIKPFQEWKDWMGDVRLMSKLNVDCLFYFELSWIDLFRAVREKREKGKTGKIVNDEWNKKNKPRET